MQQRAWFITGISSGLGKALAETVMEKGDLVIGTFRQQQQVDEFNTTYTNQAFAVKLDVTNAVEVTTAIATIQKKFGRIDILVNNAGYGLAGAIEEAGEAEVRAIFEANFFGTLRLTQAVLPVMRQQRNGNIIQISSHSGFKGFPGFGIYGATKFAVEGFSEALAAEVAPLNIRVTIVEPGPFRTRFAGNGFVLAQTELADYKATAGVFRQRIKAVDGQQEGDPAKAAAAIYEVTQLENPPLRLPLGRIAIGTLLSKLESVQRDIDAFKMVAEGAVF